MTDQAEQNARRLAEEHGLRFVDLTQSTLAPGASNLLPEGVARRHHVVPIGRRLGTPVIAVSDPGDLFAMDALRSSIGREFVAVVARKDQVTRALRQLYSPGEIEPEEPSQTVLESQTANSGFGAVSTQTSPVITAVALADVPPVMETVTQNTAETLVSDSPSQTLAHGLQSEPELPEVASLSLSSTPPETLQRSLSSSPLDALDSVSQDQEALSLSSTAPNGSAISSGDSGISDDTSGVDVDSDIESSEPSGDVDAELSDRSSKLAANSIASENSLNYETAEYQANDYKPNGNGHAKGLNGNGKVGVTVDPDSVETEGIEESQDITEEAPKDSSKKGSGKSSHVEATSTSGQVSPHETEVGEGVKSTLEESLREVLSPPEGGVPFYPPLPPPTLPYQPHAVDDESLPPELGALSGDTLGDTSDSNETGARAELDVDSGALSTLGADLESGDLPLVFPDPEATFESTQGSMEGEESVSSELPPAPPGYGLIPEPAGSPIFYGPPLARVLVEAGRVSPEDMATALQAHQDTGESLARYLFNHHLAKEDDLVWAMAQEVGLEFIDLSTISIDHSAVTLVPEATARHHVVLPIGFNNGVPIVAMANPTDVFAMDDLRTLMGRNFTTVVATRSQIQTFLRYSYDTDVNVSDVADDAEALSAPTSGFELESLQAVVEDAPIVRYVNLLILQALNERASDIHIEPTPKRLRIRFRIDGVMHEATSASSSITNAVISRLKVLGEMDITEHRIPQEGRVSLAVSDRQIDLRIAVLPSIYGETVVMRLLDKSASLRSLSELGFFEDTLERYAKCYHNPYGVVLVTGPTGAGKTTTLYSTLAEVLSPEKSVVTVEDPIEYQIDGITQVQINAKAGLNFSNALKSILRADPDIVLIGEIRTTETANIAMEAALSGHLVLSTLHTNTAAATPLRLTEMGIEPFLVTSAVGCVLTQRLARMLCENCKEPFDASEKDYFAAGYKEEDLEGLDLSVLYRTVGCRQCGHTGYLGRMVLAEVMAVTEEIDRMIIEQDSIASIERKACEQGMRTLRQDGLLKASQGLTTLEEVLRVVV